LDVFTPSCHCERCVCVQVCHHYLAPTLSQLPHDASLLKSPPPPASAGTGGNPPPAAVPSPSFSTAGGQSGTTTADAPPEEGAENKENLPELITEVTSNGVVLRIRGIRNSVPF
jgi:hypothetical protein